MKQNKFSAKKYIIEKGRNFPIHQCLVADAYDDMGLTACLIVRQQPSGKFMFANLLLDRCCLGVKSSFCNCNFDDKQLDELKERMQQVGEIREVDPTYFHNLVYATIDFAEENGFKPDRDFEIAERILDPDMINDGIDEIEVGDAEGKPLFIQGPYDDVDKIIAKLNRKIGAGNYNFIAEP